MAADADPAPEVLAAVRMHQVAVGRLARLVVASGRSSHAMVAAALAEGPTAVAVVGTAGPGLVLDLDCRQFQHLLVARMELVALVLGLARRLLASVCVWSDAGGRGTGVWSGAGPGCPAFGAGFDGANGGSGASGRGRGGGGSGGGGGTGGGVGGAGTGTGACLGGRGGRG